MEQDKNGEPGTGESAFDRGTNFLLALATGRAADGCLFNGYLLGFVFLLFVAFVISQLAC